MDALLEDNFTLLHQGLELTERITAANFTQPTPQAFGSTVGGHLRHNIDHYQCFLLGIGAGQIDYDAREREPRVENEPHYAAAVLRGVMLGLEHIEEEWLDRPLRVKMDCGGSAVWSTSSVRRELQFLVSHTIHHYALIAIILGLQGETELPAGFGVAPSTIKHHG